MISKRSVGFSVIIALIQLLDIVIHVATNQAEPIRIASNVIILLWLGSVLSGKFLEQGRRLAFGAIGLYLILNLMFLATQGIVNSESGQIRIALFVLVALTVGLSILMIAIDQRGSHRNG